jgi:hypothetical protein
LRFAVPRPKPYNLSASFQVPIQFQSAGVAQLVEQCIRNAKVTSSIPVTGTMMNIIGNLLLLIKQEAIQYG